LGTLPAGCCTLRELADKWKGPLLSGPAAAIFRGRAIPFSCYIFPPPLSSSSESQVGLPPLVLLRVRVGSVAKSCRFLLYMYKL
jgi:hypothetical protein